MESQKATEQGRNNTTILVDYHPYIGVYYMADRMLDCDVATLAFFFQSTIEDCTAGQR